jgi:hypothetical protein
METVGMIIWGIGGLVALIGFIWFLVVAFRQTIWWGLGSLFIPIVALVFLIMHWGDAAKPFFVWLLGVVIMIVVAILLPGAIPTT